MNPKEKATQLLNKYSMQIFDMHFNNISVVDSRNIRTCAFVCASEIRSLMVSFHGREIGNNLSVITYWENVRTEIENYAR